MIYSRGGGGGGGGVVVVVVGVMEVGMVVSVGVSDERG